ncbi:MAG: outer membrane protein assembly factor BamA [Syntrophobacteraceae bacterium]|nr:outer membrane protein assembly factor BamA [Syntrophobacteraceae bacterium]
MRKWAWMLCLLVMVSGAWAQEQAPKVAVLPFLVNTAENRAGVQNAIQDLLTAQMNDEGIRVVDSASIDRGLRSSPVQSEGQARSVAGRLNAQYALLGSYNQIGSTISLDAKLVDVLGARRTQSLFVEETGAENLASATKSLVQQMSVHVMAKGVIGEIQVRGNDRIEAEAIKLNIKSKPGEVLRPDVLSEDIKTIFKMGYFENVDAQVTDGPTGKVLTFVVQENPTVSEVKLSGNKKLKDKDLLAAISTKPFALLSRSQVNDDVQKILKLYQQKGYFAAEVKSSITFPQDPRKALVAFQIDENKKVYISKISFTGNKNISARKLRGVMQTKQKDWIFSMFTERGVLQRDILESDVDRITVFYHDKGFMDAKVGTPEVTRQDDGFHIEVPIQEGERYKVKTVNISGDSYEGEQELAGKLELESSGYFSREGLRKDVDFISRAYMDEGYAYTEVDPKVQRDPAQKSAEVDYSVRRGEKTRIGTITVTGNTRTRDKVIRREMQLNEGDTFSSTKLEKSLTRLKKLDFFEQVEIVPTESEQKGIMNLLVKVKEKFTGTISVGGGYSSDDGFFASGEITQRNFQGRGQYLAFKGHLGQESSRFVGSFTEPWIFDRPISLGVDLYNWAREYTDFDKDAVGGRIRSGFLFGNYSKLTLYYTLENAEVTDIQSGSSAYLQSQEGEFLKSSITLGVERDSTDHPFLPTRGGVTSLTTELSAAFLGSESDFVRTELHSGWFFPIIWKFVGYVRGEVGQIWELEGRPDDSAVPIYERFFLGGINSLRGFKWGDVGPKKGNSVVGGLQYVEANAELLFPVYEQMGVRGVVFFDVGNAAESGWDIDWRYDAGVGLRWNSPLGPLRLEWGYNLDRREGEDPYQWQFSAGAFF